ncbi:MAG: hypothetical protein ACFFF4_11085 [Candidatus Thorarchaeota archaeon]
MDAGLIQSTLSETLDKDIPPIAFKVDRSGTAMEMTKFPQRGCYLRLSREPGQSLSFEVWGYQSYTHDHSTLKKIIQRRFYSSKHIPLRLRKKGTVEIAGINRISREFTTSRSATKKRRCAVLIPSPDGGPYGLVLLFSIYVGARRLGLKSVLEHPVHKQLAESFRLS